MATAEAAARAAAATAAAEVAAATAAAGLAAAVRETATVAARAAAGLAAAEMARVPSHAPALGCSRRGSSTLTPRRRGQAVTYGNRQERLEPGAILEHRP